MLRAIICLLTGFSFGLLEVPDVLWPTGESDPVKVRILTNIIERVLMNSNSKDIFFS